MSFIFCWWQAPWSALFIPSTFDVDVADANRKIIEYILNNPSNDAMAFKNHRNDFLYNFFFKIELTDVIISFPRFVFRCVRNGLTSLKDYGVSSALVRLTAIEDQRRIGTQATQLVLTFRNLEMITRWIVGI